MPVKWKKQWISDETYETAGVFDVDGDGLLDIVSGAFWYKGPDFRKKFFLGEPHAAPGGEYYDDFSTIAMDVNGDGRLDFVTGGWWGKSLRWRENPADPAGHWPEHFIAETGSIETARGWDLDGDGIAEIVPNTPGANSVSVFKLKIDKAGKGAGAFERHVVFEFPEEQTQGHGLGCGDIAGNGRMDIALCKGWLESPADPFKGKWKWHPLPDYGWWGSSVPMLVVDVNGDGANDLIVGNGHGYGLIWLEHKGRRGGRKWITHKIDPDNAQYHDMMWLDVDGDGKPELLTGKRHRAHCGNDAGEWDDYGIYYFKWNGETFSKQVIAYGPIGETKGCGIHFAAADFRKTGRPDLVAPGKDGLFVFFNEGC